MLIASADGFGVLVVLLIILGIYFLPTIVGALRSVVNIGSVVAINLLLGWTLIGWAVAMAMAMRTNPPHVYPQPRRSDTEAAPRGPSTSGPPAGWYDDPQGSARRRWWDGTKWTEHTTDAG